MYDFASYAELTVFVVNETAVLAGIAEWERETCVRFERQWTVPIGNGLEFIGNKGCFSYYGKIPLVKAQEISIGPECSLGSVYHEIGHALDFYHEHNRSDRDSYIVMNYNNVPQSDRLNYDKVSAFLMKDYGVSYDYGSIMHYRADVYDNNNIVMMPLDPNYVETIGQREALSFRDIKKINLVYCSSKCSNTLNCKKGGYLDPNDCNKCKCPLGLGGQLCGIAAGPCGQDFIATNAIQTVSAVGVFRCNYFIKAPAGKKIFFRFRSMSGFPKYGYVQCGPGYVTVNFNSDFTKSGVHVCSMNGTPNLPSAVSESDQMIVIYQGWGSSPFTLEYRIN